MYIVSQICISKDKYSALYEYMKMNSVLAKNLYNAALFRIRQIYTGYDKQTRSENEEYVFSLIEKLENAYPSIHVKKIHWVWPS